MSVRQWITDWPVYRQITGPDPLGKAAAAQSQRSRALTPRTATADRVVTSVCPYCGVGCSQNVYVKDEKVVQIEGNPDSPVSRGRLCPKGAASLQLTTGPSRRHQVLYRPPRATDWQPISLEKAMDMVADRVIATRADTWQEELDGKRTARTMGIASLGGATLDNEENYLIKKLLTALGVVQIENQARVCHSSTVVGLGTSFGRGGATTFLQDLQHSDCIIIEGSNFAECHPVGFQWVMEAKARGAVVIHVDPRFTRTSALADLHVPIRAGTDVAFLGGIINHVLSQEKYFTEFILNYTNAATIVEEEFRDTEDVDGLFSGFEPDARHYKTAEWQYEGVEVASASGKRGRGSGAPRREDDVRSAGRSEQHGMGSAAMDGRPRRDDTMQDPRCVLQILKRHFARYTPEMVEKTCGITPDVFAEVCRHLTENSGADRTSEFVYAVGWTQHSTGSQFIRAACVLQLLLGNMGRPGGGIQALRGHASIQGSSDIPTLFNLLPGYIPMPYAMVEQNRSEFIEQNAARTGFWANMDAYLVSLLKAWWGDAATADNDFCFDYLPRLTGSHSTYDTVFEQLDGKCKGYFLLGENAAVGSANAKMQRLGMANLDWLVVRDFSLIESATWWKDGPEVESGEMSPETNDTEVFFFPAAAHTEKSGSFTNTNRMLQWHDQAVEPAGDARSDLWFMYHLGRIIREKLSGSTESRDRPILDLVWEYPTVGTHADPDADAILAEINGFDADGNPLDGYTQLREDGSTSCGCWIYCGVHQDGVNQSARRKPRTEDDWVALEWGWAWPANRRILYNRCSAKPDGSPWSERKKLVWWDADQEKWTGLDVPDIEATKPPDYRPDPDATGVDALSGIDPFIMQADGKAWLYVPSGLADGPLPTHYEPQDSPVANPLYGQQRSPSRMVYSDPHNRYAPHPADPGASVYPYVATTYRLTEQFTAGGMSRWTPYLAELQPEMFCEVSPELASERSLVNGGWATVVSPRGVIEARVLVTDRVAPLRVDDRVIHQVGLPYHWGPNGLSTGDAANELSSIVLDPNSHIQEVKAFTVDITPGRRPRGADANAMVADYQRRAGVTDTTGTEV
ncbi:formate dehydrogenase [Mycolicibacterium sp. P1-18]|uniref:formate dehydrogenase n=1 Tax=Mycolicibacterium sp. P1-18 TaxID=2024615 RepID=UPI0011F3B45D|nr:formate dehydrogenase [Mycolicibacterium sp. P1-18]KAA0101048.1 formate dehydrogenase [Mycolicibacterium sp. P1-18]